MRSIKAWILGNTIWRDQSGPTAVEYAVLLALIIVKCVASVQSLGSATHDSLWTVVEALE